MHNKIHTFKHFLAPYLGFFETKKPFRAMTRCHALKGLDFTPSGLALTSGNPKTPTVFFRPVYGPDYKGLRGLHYCHALYMVHGDLTL
jgi:hypothetical protein